MNMTFTLARATALLALLLAGTTARATLGEPDATVERDRQALAMERTPAVSRGGLAVHQLSTGGTTVREFVAADGTVFAVAWSGMARPDLAPLLGAYHAGYRAAAARALPSRGPRRVEAGQVVVETWGHARSLHGRAYLPALVPAGVSLDDLQ
jgi:hypothetical protein